jgi:hypothetical protein
MSDQLALLDIPPANPTKRRRELKEKDPGTSGFYKAMGTKKPDETIHQTLARFSREAAENRARLRREGRL